MYHGKLPQSWQTVARHLVPTKDVEAVPYAHGSWSSSCLPMEPFGYQNLPASVHRQGDESPAALRPPERPARSDERNQAYVLLTEGNRAFAAHDYKDAVELYKYGLEIAAGGYSDLEARMRKGIAEAYLHLGDPVAAAEHARLVTEIRPTEDTLDWHRYATTLKHSGIYKEMPLTSNHGLLKDHMNRKPLNSASFPQTPIAETWHKSGTPNVTLDAPQLGFGSTNTKSSAEGHTKSSSSTPPPFSTRSARIVA
jgi:hypothetical protein